MKLLKYEEAKKDCDYVLQIDGSNIKALYRRALAYKGLEVRTKSNISVNPSNVCNGYDNKNDALNIGDYIISKLSLKI